MRGEKQALKTILMRLYGSSPHARGKAVQEAFGDSFDGITPACAGKSWQKVFACAWPWDHPRMRGEKFSSSSSIMALKGSPPHARGKVLPFYNPPSVTRITPACAGKRLVPAIRGRDRRDHPRMRGEKQPLDGDIPDDVGSPPHARGKDYGVRRIGRPRGITPACAGKRRALVVRQAIAWDHPRMRGEKALPPSTPLLDSGSPPHARGKAAYHDGNGGRNRITPACAGKRRAMRTTASLTRDHPRMRGEKIAKCSLSKKHEGSPPHARGKALRGVARSVRTRITPACAGKRLSRRNRVRVIRDHPRMRGEKS